MANINYLLYMLKCKMAVFLVVIVCILILIPSQDSSLEDHSLDMLVRQ